MMNKFKENYYLQKKVSKISYNFGVWKPNLKNLKIKLAVQNIYTCW